MPAEATHLVGGSMSYEYLGLQNSGLYRYRITVQMYRDCAASNVLFDNSIDVGVYNNNGSRSKATTATLSKISEVAVDPPAGGSDCAFEPNTCLRQAIYQGFVDLNSSSVGYHLVYQRCCRNTQVNILDDLGQTYYAFIPSTSIRNNSPYFTDVPAPYICQNDLISIYNTARDIDGDTLVYKLATPWTGGTDSDPVPFLPANWPHTFPNFPPVIYRNGYSFNNPFGNSGVANIDSRNGVTELLSPQQGRFSIAIDVEEYRNGVLLSVIRLDIQMIVIKCDPNATPAINTSQNTYSFEVIEGQQLCFDITSTDSDGDDVKISATSTTPLFTGGNGFGNTATFTTKTGTGSVTSQFCWTPSCGRASANPYLFTVEGRDDGCPPKKRLENISILVKPFVGVTGINGPDKLCAGVNGIIYSANGSTGSTYNWVVNGGAIISGQGTDQIVVDWNNGSFGTVEVTEVNSGGCSGNTIQKNIQILPAPTTPVVTGLDTVCEFSSGVQYSIPPTNGFTYQWVVQGGAISGAQNSSDVIINWGAKGEGVLGVIQVNSLGCGSDTSYFPVHISRSEIDSLYGSPSVCPHIKAVEYRAEPVESNSTYIWTIVGGTQSSGGSTGQITVDWGAPTNGSVEVRRINQYNCISDPVKMDVLVNHALQGMTALGPDTLCENSSGIEYRVIYTNGSKYHWSIQGGTIVQNDSSEKIIVDWGSAGTGKVVVFEESYDSVTNTPCISLPSILNVYLGPYPVAGTISGPDEICQSPELTLYTYSGYTNSTFNWIYSGPGPIQGQGNDSVELNTNTAGTFTISVIETSDIGCVGPQVDKSFIVHPKPKTTGIFGDTIVCYPRYTGNSYNVNGFANSDFTWTIDNGTITQGTGTDQILIDFDGTPQNRITVFETSEFGCIGDTLTSNVFLDDPSLDMTVISVNLKDETKIDVSWKLINAPLYDNEFVIQRRIFGSNSSNWTDVGRADKATLQFQDKGLNTDNYIYEYRIVGFNLCKDSLFSEVHRNVQINGKKPEDDEYAVDIFWNMYNGWSNPISQYEVYRKDGRGELGLVNNLNDTFDFYTDGTKSFRQCYRIKTYESSTNEFSWSNEICFDFKPILIVPNAFTANFDGLNDQFEIVFASIKTYELNIYDRWGEKIFTSNSPENFWDGSYRGKIAQEGVYIYTIRYTGADDRIFILKGNVTMLK